MPDKETILERTAQLPLTTNVIVRGIELEDDEIWEGEELGATFKVTRERLANVTAIYSLSVGGERRGVRKVIRDFVDTFGQPMTKGKPIPVSGLRFFIWDAQKIDDKRVT